MEMHERRGLNEFFSQRRKTGITVMASEQHPVPGTSEEYIRRWLTANGRAPSGSVNRIDFVPDGSNVPTGFYASADVTTEELLENVDLLQSYGSMYREAMLECSYMRGDQVLKIASLGMFEDQLILRLDIV